MSCEDALPLMAIALFVVTVFLLTLSDKDE